MVLLITRKDTETLFHPFMLYSLCCEERFSKDRGSVARISFRSVVVGVSVVVRLYLLPTGRRSRVCRWCDERPDFDGGSLGSVRPRVGLAHLPFQTRGVRGGRGGDLLLLPHRLGGHPRMQRRVGYSRNRLRMTNFRPSIPCRGRRLRRRRGLRSARCG